MAALVRATIMTRDSPHRISVTAPQAVTHAVEAEMTAPFV